MLAGPDGKDRGVIARGDEPRVSPDGTRLFCNTVGPMSLHVARVQASARDAAVKTDATDLQWTVAGDAILGYSIDDRCVYRFAAGTLARTEVACGAAGFAQDPTGKTLAIHGEDDTVSWIDAATGKVRGSAPLSGARSHRSEDEVVSADGLFAELSDDQTSILVADRAHGKATSIDAPAGHFFEGVRATRWIGGAIVVVESDHANVTIRRIDVRAALR